MDWAFVDKKDLERFRQPSQQYRFSHGRVANWRPTPRTIINITPNVSDKTPCSSLLLNFYHWSITDMFH